MSDLPCELATRLDLAVSAAREAGQLTLKFFQRDNLAVERKADNSPVTEADRQAEQRLRERIRDAFPDDGILGEEFGEQAGVSDFRWILDPIDGTKSFICGVPLYGTLIGVERAGASEIGVIYVPGLDECVYAATGGGAWYTRGAAAPRAARVSQRDRLCDAVFLTSQLDNYYPRGAQQVYLELERTAYITRTWGDCYGYLLVATGRADVMIDPIMNLWDAAALQPVLEEAGGVYTDWSGRPTIHGGEGIGCNGLLLDQVLAITQRFARA
ncbi:MAG: histidinol-phosphatase [Candidatus Anammoximicrobium sp.]|nr:histidinol-phosphatase [Candidatus Anammoximicrobium sp.]